MDVEPSEDHQSKKQLTLRTTAAFDYSHDDQIGVGTYGTVWKARERGTGKVLALKKIRMENEKEGFPITSIREIKILKSVAHINIVKLKEIVTSADRDDPTSVFLVFEYIDHDLAGLLDSPFKNSLQPEHIKCYMKQLLEAVLYLHNNHILHRDIKAANLLISNNGTLKLADFGLARPIFPEQQVQEDPVKGFYTNKVVTLWYRAPELLMGCSNYGFAIDIWSVGCILAEFLIKKPLFFGNKLEIEQLNQIWSYFGTPTDENWPDFKNMPYYETMKPAKPIESRLKKIFSGEKPETVSLLEGLMTLDPGKRLTANDALDHDYFWEEPLPCEPTDLPRYNVHSHEYTVKRKRGEIPHGDNHEHSKRHKYEHDRPFYGRGGKTDSYSSAGGSRDGWRGRGSDRGGARAGRR